ncbi:transcription factor [Candidatus Woesearchaeota archaeon]|nr:transcription factor [Candidatus Woesearchaeota archaeon]
MAKKIRLTNKLIHETLVEAVGDESLVIINFLKNRKNISEFVISEKTKVEIHHVRKILYKLHQKHLAVYKRKKDAKKGYYISYWTFNKKRIKDIVLEIHREQLTKLKERLMKEEQNKGCFFLCANACARLDFDQGSELEFRCPECGSLLQQQDNERTIEHLKQKIKELEVFA